MTKTSTPESAGLEVHALGIGAPIPPSSWGKDHRTTLLYAETRAVDYGGQLSDPQMRVDRRYPTRLAGGVTVVAHTDYDCLRDAEAAGFVKLHGDEPSMVVEFTEPGWQYVWAMRREIAERQLAKTLGDA